MRQALALLMIVGALETHVLAEDPKRPMTVDDLLAVKSVSDPQVAPDGTKVVYVVSEVDREANKSNSALWLVPIEGGEPRRLTTAPGTNNHPRWSPDGSTIAFVSDRGGSPQVWLLPLDGGEARQLTRLPVGVSGPIWSPTGTHLAVTAEVLPGSTPEETAAKAKEKEGRKSSERAFDQLMIRHWQAWDEGPRSHLFVVDAGSGEAKDLIPGWTANVPPAPFGGSEAYSFSNDGETIAFTSEPLEDLPWSTNTDIWLVPTAGGEARNITEDNAGADAQPLYSPDGRWLAFVRQQRAGFEADRWVLHVVPAAEAGEADPISLTGPLDRPVSSYVWEREAPSLLAVVDDEGDTAVYRVHALARMAPVPLLKGGGSYGTAAPAAGGAIVFTRSSADRPEEVWLDPPGPDNFRVLTHYNDDLIAQLDLSPAESFTFEGADGANVQGWLVRPPGFEEGKTYPVLFLIHGGPQGSWHDSWHARWNLALFAAPGYAVVAVNPRGSTGFGQEFTDQISQDWSGRVYEDLMKGLDHALATYSFLDGDRMAAAGGSYGGYMVNWIAGHSDRFKALISHAGVFDLHSMYFTTEELWFPEWEFGGTPWDNPTQYQIHSPSNYVQNFQTPTLVIHGALDFRVPDSQGLGMFTALQRRGVPSRYVLFPDEGHWIARAANRAVWWQEFHGWLAKYLAE